MAGNVAFLTRRRVVRVAILVCVLLSIRLFLIYPSFGSPPEQVQPSAHKASSLDTQFDYGALPDPDFDDLSPSPAETIVPVDADVREAVSMFEEQAQVSTTKENAPADDKSDASSKVLVVASMRSDNTSWYHEFFPEWQKTIYVMDDPKAEFTVSRNKGRESTAYLTYIIDNYHKLPANVLFLHSQRYQWHNEDPMYDGVPPIRDLRLSYVQKYGYANMRCTWTLGCPAELHPSPQKTNEEDAPAGPGHDRDNTENAYTQAFMDLFPEAKPDETPLAVGIPCGAQFALSRWMIQRRPITDYLRYRDWLWKTDLADAVSGRILEYTWHIIMGKPFEYCPEVKSCFCEKFGHCDLNCPKQGSCEKRFQLPRFATIPPGWPEQGSGENGFPAMGWWE